jgi:hypothetical protein
MQQPTPHLLRDAFHQPAVAVGRTAAACVHPVAAWEVLPRSWRILVLTVYAVTSYLTVLGALIALKP